MSENNQVRIQQIWSEIAQWEAQKTLGVSLQTQEQIDRDIKAAKKEIAELEAADQAAEQAEREQQIEKKVASIELPYDFNDLYENSTANDTIIEIVQQFKRQDLVEHNAEIQRLTQAHKDELRAASDRENQLQRQNNALQQQVSELEARAAELLTELKDVKQSRDNAAAQVEEQKQEIDRLNSHIDDLVKEQAVGAREAHKVIETNPTLNELIEKANAEKQAKIKSAAELVLENGVPFRGKVELPSVPQQELPFPVAPQIEPNSDQLPSAEASAPVAQEQQFPTVTAPAVGPVELPTQSGDGPLVETATKDWVREQIAELRKELMGEESQVA